MDITSVLLGHQVQAQEACEDVETYVEFPVKVQMATRWMMLKVMINLGANVAVRTIPPDQVHLIGSTGLDSRLVLVERSVKEWVGILRDSGGGLLGTMLHTR